jgi:hypothetical protein
MQKSISRQQPSRLGEIIPEWWATSSRKPGRHHSGLPGRLRRNPQRGHNDEVSVVAHEQSHSQGVFQRMSNFDPLLKALQAFKAQGDAGFEGLVRDCLEKLSQRTLRLQKSGAQGGQDFRSDTNPGSPMIAIEAKRFQTTTNLPLDELKSKLRESLEASPAPDLWGVVLSSEMKQPDWSELEQIGAEYGVSLLCMDWREAPGTLPILAALCAAGREIAELRFGSNLAATFDAIEKHPDLGRITDSLRGQLNAPEVGFDLAKEAAANWLHDAVGSASKAKQVLRSHADILSAEAHRISRPGVEQKITDWWSAGPKAQLALLGDEGRGKTWIALSWCLTKIRDTGAPLVLVTSAKDIHAEDSGAIITGLLHRCMASADRDHCCEASAECAARLA